MSEYKRRAGRRWRLLVHGLPRKGEKMNHAAHHVSSFPMNRHPQIEERLHADDRSQYVELPDTEFDELVVDQWCHIEQMGNNYWWMNIGGVTLHVTADRDGKPKRVTVHMPGSYAPPVDGCEYHLNDRRGVYEKSA